MVTLYTKKWKINNVQTVLFDKDGTFIDSHIYWGRIIQLRVRAVMNHYNIDESLFDELCLSLGLNCKTQKLIPEGPIALLAREAVINSLINKLKKYNVIADVETIGEIFKEVHKEFLPQVYDYVKLIDEAKDLFECLKAKNVQLAVVTSDVRANTQEILRYLDLNKYFDLIIGKDDCSKAKKTGEPALIALEKLNANPKTTISIGDAQMDYEMAKNAELKGAILVATGQSPISELKTYTNTVVETLRDVEVIND